MTIAIDISPLASGHKIRGVGFYLQNLKDSLVKYFPDNTYIFFNRQEEINQNIDIIHYPYFDPFFVTLPFINKYKTVVTVHDLMPFVFPEHFPAGIKGTLSWQFQKRALQKADAIITDSYCSQKDIMCFTNVPKEKIHVIYLAAHQEYRKIELSDSQIKTLQRKYNLPEKFLLYVGDVTWNKNLSRLVEAVAKTDVPLVMVGKSLVNKNYDKMNIWNQDLVQVQKLIERNDQVVQVGFIPTKDLVALYNLATAFIMPSLYEGFGLPVLEAMECEVPVIATKEGSLPEVCGDAAYYVDPYTIESIAKGVNTVFSDEIIQRKLIEKGQVQAKKFNWEKTAKETINVYKSV